MSIGLSVASCSSDKRAHKKQQRKEERKKLLTARVIYSDTAFYADLVYRYDLPQNIYRMVYRGKDGEHIDLTADEEGLEEVHVYHKEFKDGELQAVKIKLEVVDIEGKHQQMRLGGSGTKIFLRRVVEGYISYYIHYPGHQGSPKMDYYRRGGGPIQWVLPIHLDEYLSDCPELVEKIKSNELNRHSQKAEIVKYYNRNCHNGRD